MYKILIGVPTHNRDVDLGIPIITSMLGHPDYRYQLLIGYDSILPNGFNNLFCQAINEKFTHFFMWHADIMPLQPNFLHIMLQKMLTHRIDLLGHVSPIKNDQGLSSLAWIPDTNEPIRTRRDKVECIRLEDFSKYPEVFHSGVRPGWKLLINTGLMLVNLTKSWVKDCYFQFHTWTEPDPNNPEKRVARNIPEDWDISLQFHNNGGRVFGCQLFPMKHWGKKDYEFRPNPKSSN